MIKSFLTLVCGSQTHILVQPFQTVDSECFAVWHEEADAQVAFCITWITQEPFSEERRWIMSSTSIGFVFLLGILHVCSGKMVIENHP